MQHRFSRTELLIGAAGLASLSSKKVAVFGLGGVGSYTAEALARSGVGKLVLIDYDIICLTNINRQVHALETTVDQPKVTAMAERLRLINPKIELVLHQEFFSAANCESILTPDLDYIVDAIDTVSSKVELILYAKTTGIPIIASMGTGNKLDPLQFKITDISQTHLDPLARAVRSQLRKRGISEGVKVLFSTEPPLTPDSSVVTCKTGCICSNSDQAAYNCSKKHQIPGSIAFVPPVAGLIIAAEVVKDLLRGEPL